MFRLLVACALIVLASIEAAAAHPHVWVTFHSEVLFGPAGELIGIRHAWTFDDMFSAYAVQGTRQSKRGEYTRDELAPLAKDNVEALKEYAYFTFARLDGAKAQFTDPTDYWLEYKGSSLTLHLTLLLRTPQRFRTAQIEIYDPTIFVDFEFAKDNPVSIVGPNHCRMDVGLPHQPTANEQLRLSELDFVPLDSSSTFGEMFANKIALSCS